jgi:hypothetical protein
MPTRGDKSHGGGWDHTEIFGWAGSVIITIFAIILHIHFLRHAGGLWRDEANLVNVAERSTLSGMATDSFPVLMPVLVHAWEISAFGRTDIGLRCLGLLLGLGLAGMLWASSWVLHRQPPLFGLALFALNVTAIIYGDSLRAYGLGGIFAIALVPAAWRLLARPSPASLLVFTLVAVLGVQSIFFDIPLVFAACAGVTWVAWRRRQWQPAALALTGGAVAALTLLPYWPEKITELQHPCTLLHNGFHLNNLDKAPGFPFVWLALLLFAAWIAWVSWLAKNGPEHTDCGLFLGVTLAAACAGFLVFCWLGRLPTHRWYFIPLMGMMAACFDGCWPLAPGGIRKLGLGFVLAFALVAIPSAFQELRWRFTTVDLLAGEIGKRAVAGDYAVVSPWYDGISFNRYCPPDLPWATVPPVDDHLTHRYDLVDAQLQNPRALDPVLEKIVPTLKAGNSVWFITEAEDLADEEPPPNAAASPADRGEASVLRSQLLETQVMDFLRHHAADFGKIAAPHLHGVGNTLETPNLYLAKGWKPQPSARRPAPDMSEGKKSVNVHSRI